MGRQRQAIAALPLLLSPVASILVPGDTAPLPFSVSLLGGGESTYSLGANLPVVVHAWNTKDAFTSVFWNDQINSVQPFLQEFPNATNLLVMSYSETLAQAQADMEQVQHALNSGMSALGWSSAEQDAFMKRVALAAEPVQNQPSFIPGLLAASNWSSPIETVAVMPPGGTEPVVFPRLDSFYGWLPWPVPGTNFTFALGGSTPCSAVPASVNGTLALLQLDGSETCGMIQMALNAQTAGASGVLFALPNGTDLFVFNCNTDAECAQAGALGITVSQVSFEAGVALAALFATPGAPKALPGQFVEQTAPGFFVGIDEVGQLFELGWLKLATARFLSWEGQWREYYAELRANLTRAALVVPVANFTVMQGSPGIVANVTLPPLATLATSDVLELDFALSCPGAFQESCAIWDRTLELTVCCEMDEDTAADAYAIPAVNRHGAPDEEALTRPGRPIHRAFDSRSSPMCGAELGRWITPFRRGVGRWLTDVTPLMPLFTSGASARQFAAGRNCSFNLYTDSWAMPWVDTLALRVRNSTAKEASSAEQSAVASLAAPPRPRSLLPLYTGGNFDKTYNNRSAVSFGTPSWAGKTLLYAVTTGHGSDENGAL